MKKLFLSLLVAGCATSAFAQPRAGSIFLYGVGSYSSTRGSETTKTPGIGSNTTDDPKTRNYVVAPGVGFNITKNLSVGMNIGVSGSKTNWDKSTLAVGERYEAKSYEFFVGPFVRYTQMMGEHFFALAQFNVNYLHGKNTNNFYQVIGTGASTEDTWNGVNSSLVPAVGVMVSRSCALTFGVGGAEFNYRKYDFDNNGLPGEHTAKRSDFTITFGQQFNLGIQKYFGCGRHHARKGHHQMMDDTRRMDTSDDSEDDMPKKKKHRRDDDDE